MDLPSTEVELSDAHAVNSAFEAPGAGKRGGTVHQSMRILHKKTPLLASVKSGNRRRAASLPHPHLLLCVVSFENLAEVFFRGWLGSVATASILLPHGAQGSPGCVL